MLLLAFVLPTLLPWGEEVSIEAPGWTGTYGTGGRVWPAAESLCRHLLIEEPSMAGEEVLELGAGHGAVGIFAAKLGAERVEITDRSEEVLNLARRNAAGLANVRVRRYRWGEPVGFCPSLVLGSDITYDIESHEALCWTLGEVVLRGGPREL
ncbi:hypothetical protein CTAYLR_001011 [Chrysophaeum taylorii]|uniref:Methyltransferase n=1 Tax=Chrysophaeum taylorii TaxID=2483200 RepID=A0AAD7UFL2_9STRA|nr:hypothetical protein CTAYLR_001011 [Chrysophaeum taylorii]